MDVTTRAPVEVVVLVEELRRAAGVVEEIRVRVQDVGTAAAVAAIEGGQRYITVDPDVLSAPTLTQRGLLAHEVAHHLEPDLGRSLLGQCRLAWLLAPLTVLAGLVFGLSGLLAFAVGWLIVPVSAASFVLTLTSCMRALSRARRRRERAADRAAVALAGGAAPCLAALAWTEERAKGDRALRVWRLVLGRTHPPTRERCAATVAAAASRAGV